MPVLLLAALLLPATLVYGQTSFGSVNGTVSDPSGAVVGDVTVRLLNTATNVEARTTTNSSGYFTLVNIRPGNYTMQVELTGFKAAAVPQFTVSVGQAMTQNVVLEIGEVTQTVEVTSQTELLQASSSELGNVIEQKVVSQIPLNGRNFTQLLILTPGVNPVSTAQGSQTTVNFGAAEGNTGLPGSTIANASVQGQQNRSKIYYLDGIINTSVRGTSYIVLPDIDSIQEFNVQSHSAKTEYGGVTGGVVNMSTKSGTNDFHGSLFWLVRNELFDARDPFRDALRDDPPKFRQNQFGANLGGPVVRNKTFFFASYDGWRYRDVANTQRWIPTVELDGDFSQSRYNRNIFNPFSTRTENGKLVRDPFPNRVIPPDLINKQMQGFFKAYMYTPNTTGDSTINFRDERSRQNNANGFQVRVDHRFGDSDSIFARWNEQYVHSFNPQGDRGAKTPDATNRTGGGGWIHAFSPSVILEVRGGVATQPSEDAPLEHELGIQPMISLGFPDVDRFQGAIANMSSNPWLGDQFGVQGPRPRGNPNWNVASDVTFLRGNHAFKTGFQYINIRRLQRNLFQQYTFNQDPTRDPQTSSGSGDDLASALLGIPSRVQGLVPEYGSINFGTGTFAGYIQDEWKLRPSLTLTYGVRYDYIRRVTGDGLHTGPDLDTGQWLIYADQFPALCSAGTPPPCLPQPLANVSNNDKIVLTDTDVIRPVKDNIGPRVGLAWQIDPRTVLRTGYGLVWDSLTSRSQYAQNQIEAGWPYASGYDTGSINTVGSTLKTLQTLQGNIPFATPRAEPWNGTGWVNDPDRQDAYSHQWHVEIQREMSRALMMSVAYVGSENGRLEYAGGATSATRPGVEEGTGRKLTPAEVNQLRLYPYITGPWRYSRDIGYSNYHSFQYKMRKQFSSGLTALLSYTWSKSIDTSSGWFNAENGIGGNANVQNYHDIDSNRAVSSYDIPHLVTMAAVWEMPFGQGRRWLTGGPVSHVLGNWQMNGFLLARSGQPFTIEVAGDVANIGYTNTYARPNLMGDPSSYTGTVDAWYRSADFAIPSLSFGTAGRNILRTDGVFNADFGLQKNIPIQETRQLQLRFEAFNLFNHIDYGNPATRLDQPNPGRITSTSHSPRQMQFGLRFTF